MLTINIKDEDLAEFVGQIIDIFEDYLEEKNIYIDNPERNDAIADGEDEDTLCRLYGCEYGMLQCQIEDTLKNWSK